MNSQMTTETKHTCAETVAGFTRSGRCADFVAKNQYSHPTHLVQQANCGLGFYIPNNVTAHAGVDGYVDVLDAQPVRP